MSSISKFIRYPIETNPTTLAEAVYAYIQARAPQWVPNDGALDVWIIQALTAVMAENRELATDVPTDIFRWYGMSLIGIPPQADTPSTVTTTWVAIDNAGHTIPAGTQVGILDSAGNLVPFETIADTIIPPGSTTTSAGGVTLRSSDTGAATSGLAGVGVVLQLIDILDFVVSVTATAITTGGLDAEDDDAYLDRLATRLRLLSTRPILPNDFAILARDVAGVYRVVAIDGYNPIHNLLTANQASAETDASGWVSLANTTISSSVAQAADGAKSVGMTAVAAGDMTAVTPSTPATGLPVTPGDTITGLGSIRAATTVRSVQIGLQWLDAANAQIGSIVYGAAANDSAAAFTAYNVTAVAPALAVRVRLVPKVIAAALGELHYLDKASLRRGSATDWVPGGTGETGQPRTVAIAAVDAAGANISAAVKNAIAAVMAANREVNFIINIMDPIRNLIDVNYAAKALPGNSTVTVKASIDANLAAYMNAISWGTDPLGDPRDWIERSTIRYSDVGAIISNTDGVDYWSSLTIGIHGGTMAAADLVLPGPAALAVLSTIGGAGVT